MMTTPNPLTQEHTALLEPPTRAQVERMQRQAFVCRIDTFWGPRLAVLAERFDAQWVCYSPHGTDLRPLPPRATADEALAQYIRSKAV